MWTSSLFCERKTICKTCLKCDFILDPFVVWNQRIIRRIVGNYKYQDHRLNEVGITCYEAKIEIDFIYCRTPYAFTDYKRHYCSDGRAFFSDRSPRSHTVHKAKVLSSIIRLLCMHVKTIHSTIEPPITATSPQRPLFLSRRTVHTLVVFTLGC